MAFKLQISQINAKFPERYLLFIRTLHLYKVVVKPCQSVCAPLIFTETLHQLALFFTSFTETPIFTPKIELYFKAYCLLQKHSVVRIPKNTKKFLMKRIFIALALMLGAVFSAQAQESAKPTETKALSRHILKLPPLHFTRSTFTLRYERLNAAMTRSLQFSIDLTTMESSWNDYKEMGWGGDLEYRIYAGGFKQGTTQKGQTYGQGVYFAPYVKGEYFNTNETYWGEGRQDPNTGQWINGQGTVERKIMAFTPGAVIGWQRSFWGVLHLDVYLGGGIRYTSEERNFTDGQPAGSLSFHYSGLWDRGYSGVAPRMGFNVGIGL